MSHAEVLHLFLAADKHLAKVEPELRTAIMHGARDVLLDPHPDYVEDFGACLVALRPAQRAAFIGTLRNAAAIARRSSSTMKE